MNDIPMKMYFMGKIVDDMSRDELLEVIRHLGRELETTRAMVTINHDMHESFRKARARFDEHF